MYACLKLMPANLYSVSGVEGLRGRRAALHLREEQSDKELLSYNILPYPQSACSFLVKIFKTTTKIMPPINYSAPGTVRKKNIVLMIADDLGRNLSCYGSDCKTPNLDKLASEGVKFDQAFTSTASCSGSRSVIYTGLHTHENGMWGLHNNRNHFMTFDSIETQPQIFNELGYQTGLIGKIHVGPPSKYPWTINEEAKTRDTAWVADRAEAFFEKAKSFGKHFFLTLGFIDPHRADADRGGFGNMDQGYDARIKDVIYDPAAIKIPPWTTDVPEVRHELAEYYRSINRLDQGVGLVLQALERQGFANDTLVVFLSDNGPPFINSKTTLYDAGVHLPLIMRDPDLIPPGIVSPNMVSYIDLIPTFLDYTGNASLNFPSNKLTIRRGRSLIPIIAETKPLPDWSHIFGSHTLHEIANYWPTRFMRDRRFKYHRNLAWQLPFPFAMDLYMSVSWEGIRNSHPSGKDVRVGKRTLADYINRPAEELYDLEKDPDEVHNLATEPEYEAKLREMRKALEAWQVATGDRFIYRDGVSVTQAKEYMDEYPTMKLPDRFDLDVDNPGNQGLHVTWNEDATLNSAMH